MHSSPFSVAGMSSSTSSHHSPNLNTLTSWGSSSSAAAPTFSDSLSQSRSHYQSGYLMSAAQNNNAPQGSPHADEIPTVQTKAKMNHMLSRGSATEFGMDSMFQSTRNDSVTYEDAPPMTSVIDIPNESNFEPKKSFLPKRTTFDSSPFSSSRRGEPFNGGGNPPPYYVIVFGYPPDKYSVTVDYFKSLGNTTEADPHLEIANCFKIGYYDAGEAMRVVRKSGEILGGSFMIGVKWAEPAQAEILSPAFGRSTASFSAAAHFTPPRHGETMNVDEPSSNHLNGHSASSTPSVGTPIRLAPSTSAFRQSTIGGLPAANRSTPQNLHAGAAQMSVNVNLSSPAQQQPSPNKGLVGQAVDLIFGW